MTNTARKVSGTLRHIVNPLSAATGMWRALVIAALVLLAFDAHAQPPSTNSRAEIAVLAQIVRSANDQLRQAAATGSPGLAQLNIWLQIAEQRRAAMLSLMERSPELALQNAFPREQREQLPVDVRANVEQPARLEGSLEVLGVLFDQDNGRTGVRLNLYTANEGIQLFVETLPDDYVTGAQVVVNGVRLGNWVAALHTGVTKTGGSAAGSGGLTGAVSRRALVININFSDLSTEPWTIDFAQNAIFNDQVTPWYDDASYGQLEFQADVTGWYTISASSSTCATTTFRDQAVAAARADGFEPTQYNHVVMAFPRVAACGWAGLAQVGQVGGTGPYYAWLNNAMNMRVAVHELGHNLGLLHSHSIHCSGAPLLPDVASCARAEYGDLFDVMGTSTASYHGNYKAYLQWIPDSDVISVTPDDQAVEVTLNSVESLSGPRVLRVARPDTDPQQYFTIEMREPIGIDRVLDQYPALATGVSVYLGSVRDQSIIDMAWETTTIGDAPLQMGDTFSDPNNTLTITVLSVGNGQAVVSVNYNP